MKKAILYLIKIYQATFSPDHGPLFGAGAFRCRFYPSCSQYLRDAIEKHGVSGGLKRGILRILRCNPLSLGGVDQA
ncbi:MAG: membrane protein insertion efficiency factor YidD [Parcubacteria group bacterium]|nr:membrane protein insertion efficiency factor YidD [Parcubacteria group bacterium]